jgi:hypothetical protein
MIKSEKVFAFSFRKLIMKKIIFCFIKTTYWHNVAKWLAIIPWTLTLGQSSFDLSKWDLSYINILSVFVSVLEVISHNIILAKVYKNNLIFDLKFSSCDVLSFQVNLFFFFWFFWTKHPHTYINLWMKFLRIQTIIFCEISQLFKCEVSICNQSTRLFSKTIQDV